MKKSLDKSLLNQSFWQNMIIKDEIPARNNEYMYEFRDSFLNCDICGDNNIV